MSLKKVDKAISQLAMAIAVYADEEVEAWERDQNEYAAEWEEDDIMWSWEDFSEMINYVSERLVEKEFPKAAKKVGVPLEF